MAWGRAEEAVIIPHGEGAFQRNPPAGAKAAAGGVPPFRSGGLVTTQAQRGLWPDPLLAAYGALGYHRR